MKNIDIKVVAHELKPGSKYLLILKSSNFSVEDANDIGDAIFALGVDSVGVFVEDDDGVRVEILPEAKK